MSFWSTNALEAENISLKRDLATLTAERDKWLECYNAALSDIQRQHEDFTAERDSLRAQLAATEAELARSYREVEAMRHVPAREKPYRDALIEAVLIANANVFDELALVDVVRAARAYVALLTAAKQSISGTRLRSATPQQEQTP